MRAVLNMLGFTSGGGLSVGLNVLAQLGDVAPRDQFLLLLPNLPEYRSVEVPSNTTKRLFDVSTLKQLRRLWIDHAAIPTTCRKFGADVLFSMSNFGPYRAPCAHVLGVHLGYLAYPTWPVWARLSLSDRLFLRAQARYFAIGAAHVDYLCVLTRTLAVRMAETFGFAPDRIRVVPNAAPAHSEVELPDDAQVLDVVRQHPAGVRLCYPAVGHAHKNHEILPDVIRILQSDFGIHDVVIFVTVERDDSYNAKRFLSRVESLNLDHRIVNLGRLGRGGVSTLYRHTHALLMPTLLESLSLSYLEAMLFGVPILTSDYDFAREVCGDAALYFDPLDPLSIAGAVARVAGQPEISANLRARGNERVRRYGESWRDVSKQYVQILREACGQAPG